MISGTDLLTSITLPSNSPSGTIIARIQINPNKMPDTRLKGLAEEFVRWQPSALDIEVQSSANSTVSGSYVSGWVADPNVRVSTGISAIRTVTAMKPYKSSNVYEKTSMRIPNVTSQRWLFVSGRETEDSDHGVYFLVLSSGLGNLTSNSSVTFNINLKWTVRLSSRVTKPSVANEFIYAEDDYTPYFTDSSSDWASGLKLTFKHKEGGSIVPFPSANEGVVYEFKGTSCKYLSNAAKLEADVKYAVKIFNHPSGGMAVFSTLEKASKYAKSGADEHCLTYFGAGPEVAPYNPAWLRASGYASPLFDNSRGVSARACVAGTSSMSSSVSFLGDLP